MIISCGVVPVRNVAEADAKPTWQFLLLRSYKHWDFPKGRVEDDEAELDAALREFAEESGIETPPEFKWGADAYSTEPYAKPLKIARYFVGLVDAAAQPRLLPNPETGRVEHHEFRWCSTEEARKLVKPRIEKALDFALQLISKES